MCGIVGVITNFRNGLAYDEANMFQDMLFVDTLRGWDSTGVFGVETNNTVQVMKAALNGPDFLCTKEWKEFRTDMISRGKFLVGHNRAATKGSVKDENAHPFDIDNKIFLVQNGTYKGNHTHLKNTEVDTEAIAHVLAETPDVSEALQKVNASYALVWYNRDEKSLNIIRNDERPLHLGYAENGTIFFASEGDTILWAASRNKIKLKEAPYQLAEHHHYKLVMQDNHSIQSTCEKIDAKYKYATPVGQHRYPFSHNYLACGYSDWEQTEEDGYRVWKKNHRK